MQLSRSWKESLRHLASLKGFELTEARSSEEILRIRDEQTSPYHPEANGHAEQAVCAMKKLLKKTGGRKQLGEVC